MKRYDFRQIKKRERGIENKKERMKLYRNYKK